MMDFSNLMLDNVTLSLLIISIGIFGYLACKSRSVKSFQFHISIVILIWIIGETIDKIEENLTNVFGIAHFSAVIHMISMILVAVIFWSRFFWAKNANKRIVDFNFKE